MTPKPNTPTDQNQDERLSRVGGDMDETTLPPTLGMGVGDSDDEPGAGGDPGHGYHLIGSDHPALVSAGDDSDNEDDDTSNLSIEEQARRLAAAAQADQTNLPQNVQNMISESTAEHEKEEAAEKANLWTSSKPKDIQMDHKKIETIKNIMASFSLPASSIPTWVKEIGDNSWKEKLDQQLEKK